MTNVFAWLLAIVGPLAIRIIIALGFTAVTFTGIEALVQGLVTTAQDNWSSMPVSVLQFASLSGIPQVMGMIFGAYAARVAMWAVTGASKYVLKS